MVSLTSLWAPILISAVIVFVASSVVHMVLPYHRSDYRKVPSEDAVMDALRKFGIPPGDYHMPRPENAAAMKSPEFQEKVKKGPVVMMTVMSGQFAMGKKFAQWFLYILVVSAVAAAVACHTMAPGAAHRHVFHVVGVVAFAAYGLALWPISIWYERSWSTTLKSNIDALIYAALTGAVFGWLWPR